MPIITIAHIHIGKLVAPREVLDMGKHNDHASEVADAYPHK